MDKQTCAIWVEYNRLLEIAVNNRMVNNKQTFENALLENLQRIYGNRYMTWNDAEKTRILYNEALRTLNNGPSTQPMLENQLFSVLNMSL
jgi:hypothetical protein